MGGGGELKLVSFSVDDDPTRPEILKNAKKFFKNLSLSSFGRAGSR